MLAASGPGAEGCGVPGPGVLAHDRPRRPGDGVAHGCALPYPTPAPRAGFWSSSPMIARRSVTGARAPCVSASLRGAPPRPATNPRVDPRPEKMLPRHRSAPACPRFEDGAVRFGGGATGRDPLPISTGAAVVVIVVWRPSLRVLDLDGGEQLGLAHQPARAAGGVSWSGRSRRRSAMARVMARRWAVVLMLAPARLYSSSSSSSSRKARDTSSRAIAHRRRRAPVTSVRAHAAGDHVAVILADHARLAQPWIPHRSARHHGASSCPDRRGPRRF